MSSSHDSAIGSIISAVILIAGCIGYLMNVISLIADYQTTGWMVARVIGVFIPFIGAVLGYF